MNANITDVVNNTYIASACLQLTHSCSSLQQYIHVRLFHRFLFYMLLC